MKLTERAKISLKNQLSIKPLKKKDKDIKENK